MIGRGTPDVASRRCCRRCQEQGRAQEVSMRHRLLALLIAVAVAVAIVIAIPKLAAVFGRGLDPAKTAKATTTTDGVALKTAWGDPDLEGIWTYDHQIPLQRPEKYAAKEFFTDDEIAELDRVRAGQQRQDYRAHRGTEADVSGAYNTVFLTIRPTGRRTSLIVDPPNGRVPPLIAEAQKRIGAARAPFPAHHSSQAGAPSAFDGPAAAWRVARQVGSQELGRRRHQFPARYVLPGIACQPASRRTLDRLRCAHAPVRGHE